MVNFSFFCAENDKISVFWVREKLKHGKRSKIFTVRFALKNYNGKGFFIGCGPLRIFLIKNGTCLSVFNDANLGKNKNGKRCCGEPRAFTYKTENGKRYAFRCRKVFFKRIITIKISKNAAVRFGTVWIRYKIRTPFCLIKNKVLLWHCQNKYLISYLVRYTYH